jgi:hypothetical protein
VPHIFLLAGRAGTLLLVNDSLCIAAKRRVTVALMRAKKAASIKHDALIEGCRPTSASP